MTTSELIENAKDKISAVPSQIRAAYVSGENLRRYIAEREAQLVFDLTATHGADPLDPADKFTNLLGIIRSEFFVELAAMRALWKSFRDTDEHLAAVGIVQPMLEEIAALEAQLETENTERGAKLAALAAAEEAALEGARLAALASPEVLAARKALEALDQPAPVKIAKGKPAEIGGVS